MNEFELLALAAKAKKKGRAPNTNPGVNAEAPPEMFLNPHTGQYTSRELLRESIRQNAPSATRTAVLGAGRGATLGGIDELSGGLNAAVPGPGGMDERYTFGREYVRAAEEAMQASNGDDLLTGEVAGALSVPLAAPWQAGRLLSRAVGSAAAGAGMGAGYGFLTGEGQEERVAQGQTGAVTGAAVGAAAPAIGAGVQRLVNRRARGAAIRRAAREARKAAELRGEASDLYTVASGEGVEITPEAAGRLAGRLDEKLTPMRDTLPGRNTTPGGNDLVSTSRQMADNLYTPDLPPQTMPLEDVEMLRRRAGNVGREVNARGSATPDAAIGNAAVAQIDDFIQALQPEDVPVGNYKVAVGALEKARNLWARAVKTQSLENALEVADGYLGGEASAIRQRVGALLRNTQTRRAFTDAEIKVLRNIIGGSRYTRIVRNMGSGVGRLVQPMFGSGVAGLPGAVAGIATGELTSAMANSNAIRAAESARNLIASGRLQNLPVGSDAPRRLIEALMRRAGSTVPQQ